MARVISVIPLDIIENPGLVYESFIFVQQSILSRLAGYHLGVATASGVVVTPTMQDFFNNLMAANHGISYDDIATFAEDRANRVLAQLCNHALLMFELFKFLVCGLLLSFL